MTSKKPIRGLLARAPLAAAVTMALFSAPAAQAFVFERGGVTGSFDTTVSYGISVRAQDQDEELIGKAGPDVQLFILLSGHGMQVPIPETQTDPLDPKNPEPDGMDEVFLPADAKSWTKDGLENAIRDDQMGGWLDRMRERGAAVWIVFDCCHSGSMTRG